MREVFVGIDTGHCTGWGIVVREDDGSLNLLGAGIVPIVPERFRVKMTLVFWKELLAKFEGDKIYLCTELNVGTGFSVSPFFVREQSLSPTVIKMIDQELGNPQYEFMDLSPSVIAKLFGVRAIREDKKVTKKKKVKGKEVLVTKRPVLKSVREQIRERVIEQFGIDGSALSKSLDAWDSIVVAMAGYYIKYGTGGEFSMILIKCKHCNDSILTTKVWGSCECGATLATRKSSGVVVKATDKKKVAMLVVPDSAFDSKESMVATSTDFTFEKI